MADCKDCIHKTVCISYRALGVNILYVDCKFFNPDVIEKRAYDLSQYLLKGAYERIEQLDKLCGDLQKSNQELASKIFEEMNNIIKDYKLTERGLRLAQHGEPSIDQRYAELKKKYTESDNKE